MKVRTVNAITLIELLIAAILIGIVMLGAVSVDFAIRRGRQGMVQGNKIAMELEASMLQMTRDAMISTGDASSPTNSGIDYDDTGPIQNICFRYDADNDPNTYGGDEWTCYSRVASQYEILRCTAQNFPLGADGTCPGGSQVMHENAVDFFAINSNTTTNDIESISFDLQTCDDPSQPENPTTNPCMRIQSIVNPPSRSRELPV